MPAPLLYYITDRSAFAGDEAARRRAVVDRIVEAAKTGIQYIQLREKDLLGRDLEALARAAVEAVRGSATRLLINSRTDIAVATSAHGVHLRGHDISAEQVRDIWAHAELHSRPVIGISCHGVEQIRAAADRVDFAVFAPIFEKKDARDVVPAGLEELRRACCASVRVFALGGVTLENSRACLDAGAAGIAGIRLFQEGDLEATVRALRG
jgi:thiamine-phosphate pyrophosphorylase